MAKRKVKINVIKTATPQLMGVGAGIVANTAVDKGLALVVKEPKPMINAGAKLVIGLFAPQFMPKQPAAQVAGTCLTYEGTRELISELVPGVQDFINGLGGTMGNANFISQVQEEAPSGLR